LLSREDREDNSNKQFVHGVSFLANVQTLV
jgi:hypothetical protein